MRLAFALLILISSIGAQASLLDDARASYRRADFETFFGIAQWARLTAPAGLKREDRDRLLALELTGLARHCRWREIALLKEEAHGPLAVKAFGLIAVKEEYKRFAGDPNFKNPPLSRKIAHAREHWGATPENIKTLARPDRIRVKVRSLCASP